MNDDNGNEEFEKLTAPLESEILLKSIYARGETAAHLASLAGAVYQAAIAWGVPESFAEYVAKAYWDTEVPPAPKFGYLMGDDGDGELV